MKVKIEYHRVNELKFAPFNPQHRTSESYIQDVVESMKRDGFWEWNPLHITSDGTVADGNRRLAAAIKLGIQEVPCIEVSDIAADEVWGKINTRRNIRLYDAMEAHSKGLDARFIPLQHRKTIDLVRDIGGQELLDFLVSHAVSPRIVYEANRLAYHFGKSGDKAYIKKIIHWLVEWRMQNAIKFALNQGADLVKVKECIETNRPVTVLVGSIG